MCNLWKGQRLFLISNPCCCCSLRCGVIWVCIVSFAHGLTSSFLPIGLDIHWEVDDKSLTLAHHDQKQTIKRGESPIVQPKEWKFVPSHTYHNFFHFGALGIQIFTAALLFFMIVTRLGGFLNFIAGTLWMIGRVVITVVWTPVLYKLIVESTVTKEDPEEIRRLAQWRRYAWFLMGNVFVHVYFFFVVRYYTMESYDAWIYRPVTPQLGIRERAPGSGQRQRGTRDPRLNVRSWKKSHMVSRLREGHEAMTPVPVWRVHAKFAVYGEDYDPMDPARFLLNWNVMNAKLGDGFEEKTTRKGRGKESDDEQKEIKMVGHVGQDLIEIVDEVKRVKKFTSQKDNRGENFPATSNSVTKLSKPMGRYSNVLELDGTEVPRQLSSHVKTGKSTRSVMKQAKLNYELTKKVNKQ